MLASKLIRPSPQIQTIPIGNDAREKLKELYVPSAEIIKIGKRPLAYPCDRVSIITDDYQPYNSADWLVPVKLLEPPVKLNLRNDADPSDSDTRDSLQTNELDYYQRHGNALIFIHGFNLAYGTYSPQLIDVSMIGNRNIFNFSNSSSTIYRNLNMISPALEPTLLTDEELNGTEAHNWFVHMEHNLNLMTVFNGSDFSHYFRIINIAWSGDVFVWDFLDAEDQADVAGKRLVKLVKQLYENKIRINIVAHSLGCRVLIVLMQALAENGLTNCLERVIFWQAAIADSALSNSIDYDHSTKFNCHFPQAYQAAKFISVLYSLNDNVLHFYYLLSNYLGLSPRQILNLKESLPAILQYLDRNVPELIINFNLFAEDIWRYLQFSSGQEAEALKFIHGQWLRLLKGLKKLQRVHRAMGYHGVNLNDPFIIKLIHSGKLLNIHQPGLTHHSAMKIPNSAALTAIYRQWVINKQYGIQQFGKY